MKKLVCAAVLTWTVVGWATASDVTGLIIRVDKKGDGDKVEYVIVYKAFPKKKGEKVEPVARKAAWDCVVAKAKPNPDDPKKVDKGEPLELGLANEAFPAKDGDRYAVARLTIDDDKGTITKILVLMVPGKKKDGK
jgi:hypothetical protein